MLYVGWKVAPALAAGNTVSETLEQGDGKEVADNYSSSINHPKARPSVLCFWENWSSRLDSHLVSFSLLAELEKQGHYLHPT